MPDRVHTRPDTAPELIETMRLHKGYIALWPLHRARLLASAARLGYAVDTQALDTHVLACVQSTLSGSHRDSQEHLLAAQETPSLAKTWRVRLLLAQNGHLQLAVSTLPDTPSPVTIALATDALTQTLGRSPETGQTTNCLDSANPWLRHKTTLRPWYQAAQHWLQQHPGYFDLIFTNESGHVCEGSRSSLYVQDAQGRWLTPPVSDGLLPGVLRQSLLDGGRVSEAQLSLRDIRTAPALRISNALRGWLDARLVRPAAPACLGAPAGY